MPKVHFDNAPLKEVVMGAQFEFGVLENSHIYEYYQTKKALFPQITENPILPAIIDRQGESDDVKILNGFNARKYFIDNTGNRLIQIQKDRLLFNWRTENNKADYPHFEVILPEFFNHLNDLQKICSVKSKINQLEFTYLNHIEIEEFQLKTYQIDQFLKFFTTPPNLKSFDCSFTFPIEKINGSLTIKMKSALRTTDQKKVITLEITARGINREGQSLEEWYQAGHDTALDYFLKSLTDRSMEIWKIKS